MTGKRGYVLDMTENKPLAEQTPAEIDAQIFSALQRQWTAEDQQARLTASAHSAAGDSKVYGWARGERQGTWRLSDVEAWDEVVKIASAASNEYHVRQARELIAKSEQVSAEFHAALNESQTLQAEYEIRGGWTRAYLVDNADGHVHNTTRCSIWNRGTSNTRFHWLTELSGQAESEIVELAGERACTICYPTAPVDVLNRPSKLEGPAQQAAREAAAQRAAEKAARQAVKLAKAATKDGSELVVKGIHGYREYFKTEVSATNWLVGKWADAQLYGYSPVPVESEQAILAALADKHDTTIDEIREQLQVRLARKLKRG